MRVKAVNAKKSDYYYPDIVISCGEREFEDDKRDVLINPKVVIEIASKSTGLKDWHEKLEAYFALESLSDYVLIEQDEFLIQYFSRLDEKEWKVRLLTEASHELVLKTINCNISLADIFNEVQFENVSKKRRNIRKPKTI